MVSPFSNPGQTAVNMPRPFFCRKVKLAADVVAQAKMCYKKPVLRAAPYFFRVTPNARLQPMKTIWKFELTPNRIQSVPLPFGAQILTVQTKNENAPLMWVLVDPDMPNQERYLGIYTTNTAVPDNPGRYIGTFLIYEGSLEFHLFEMDGPPEAATE